MTENVTCPHQDQCADQPVCSSLGGCLLTARMTNKECDDLLKLKKAAEL